MSTIQDRMKVEVPRRLRARPLDTRGYPVPWVVLIDQAGVPQFTVNDLRRVGACRTKRLCALCGNRLGPDMWFIGGARCFTEEFGAFVDPPNHYECAEYALRVCPFLAAPSYAKRIDLGKMTKEGYGDATTIVIHNDMPAAQPERFGLGRTARYNYIGDASVFFVQRWDYVEWWRHGQIVGAPAL